MSKGSSYPGDLRKISLIIVIVAFFVCISFVNAASIKTLDLNTASQGNFRTVPLTIKMDNELTLFDGIKIIQNKTVMENALMKPFHLDAIGELPDMYLHSSEETSSGDNNQFEEIINCAKSPDKALKYWLISAEGGSGFATQGVLGYSAYEKKFFGEKYDSYNIDNWDNPPEIYKSDLMIRVMIDLENKKVLHQFYKPGSNSPEYEYAYNIGDIESPTLLNGEHYLQASCMLGGSTETIFLNCV